MSYTQSFLNAVNHVMLYEVGPWWNPNAPGAQDGTNSRACGYENDSSDPGGETKYGIAKNANPSVDITHLTFADTQSIYYNNYWLKGHCDAMPNRVAILHFDSCVNNGVGQAAKFLQRSLNVTIDGSIGPGTLSALNGKDPITICNSICDQRELFYNNIVSNNPGQQKYLAGWLRRINEMRAYTTNTSSVF